MRARPRTALFRLSVAAGLAGALVVSAGPAEAQVPPTTRPPTVRPPHGHDRSNLPPRPRPRPPHGHDRSNIPPRANPDPPGKGDPHGPSDPRGPGGTTSPDSRGNGNANGNGPGSNNAGGNGKGNGKGNGGPARSLASGTMRDLGGNALPASAQHAVRGLVEGSTPGAGRAVAAALAPATNRSARGEASRLASSLEGIAGRPDDLRGAVRSYNRLVDASSESFLRNPSPEFLTVQAVLALMVEEAAAGAVVP